MNDLHRRWFEPPTIQLAVKAMWSKCRKVPQKQLENVRNERDAMRNKSTLVALGGAVVFLAVVFGALVFCAPKKNGSKPDYMRLTIFCISLVGGAGAVTYLVSTSNNRKRAERDEAFEQLCRQHSGLQPARRIEFEASSVGTVPWFHTEEWIHAYGLVSGEYKGSPIISVECTHVIDPVLAVTDSRLLQMAASVGARKMKRLQLRAMDATIFVEPLPNVSDLLFIPRTDPSRAYYRRDLQHQDCDLDAVYKLPRRLSYRYWMAAAEPEECGGLFGTQLPKLLLDRRWCIVQVIGGHCVVITNQWHGNGPGGAPRKAESIVENLEFAQAVYQQLRQFSDNMRYGTAMTTANTPEGAPMTSAIAAFGGSCPGLAATPAEPSGVAAAVVDAELAHPPVTGYAAESAAAAPLAAAPGHLKRRRRRPYSLLAKVVMLGLGVPLLLAGALAALGGSVDVHRGHAARDWPRVNGRIVESKIEVETSRVDNKVVVKGYSPHVRYEYEVDGKRLKGSRIKFGFDTPSKNKREVAQIVDRYPQDSPVKVRYLAGHRNTSVLEPGVRRAREQIRMICISGGLALIGAALVLFAVIGKPIPPAR
jgi:hypothetical protein